MFVTVDEIYEPGKTQEARIAIEHIAAIKAEFMATKFSSISLSNSKRIKVDMQLDDLEQLIMDAKESAIRDRMLMESRVAASIKAHPTYTGAI